jgi:ribonucleoside-diphosphate reductase beta chain
VRPGPRELHALARRRRWDPNTIDLRRDRAEWEALPRAHRERLTWYIASFFVGEERVTNELGPLLAAHESAAEAAFLASQQADELRHARYFDRIYEQVLGIDGGFDEHLARARGELGAPLGALIDERLSRVSRRLQAEPTDSVAKVDFVTVYHMVIEGVLAVTGQQLLLEFLERRDLLAGTRAGLRLVARDERRHVAYGVWFLQQKAVEPGLRERIAEQLTGLIPLAARVLVPPGARPRWFRPLGRTGVEVHALAFGALARRIESVGVDPDAHGALAQALQVLVP